MINSLIHILILENKQTENQHLGKYYQTNENPNDSLLKCIRHCEIENVRSIDEIISDEYTTDDEKAYQIRFREIKSEYKIISEELGINVDLKEYENYKKSITRNQNLNNLGI